MFVMIQIRNVPEDIHRTLEIRAAEAGMSLSEYLLRELRALAGRGTFQEVLERIESQEPVPGVDVEVVHALRRLERAGTIGAGRAEQALSAFHDLDVIRHPHLHLMPRAWGLRQNLTTYDAAYVALAEGLEAPLLTRDRRLASAPGHAAEVRVV